MFWQREYVRKAEAMTLGGTLKLDLPKSGMLGSLLIRISGNEISGYGQSGGDWRIIDKITKVVVLKNASEVVKSLTGYQAQAVAFYDQGVIPPGDWRNYASNTQFEYLLINFGRFLMDSEMGLDLAKYGNVELQITNDATASDFTSFAVDVLAYYLRDVPAGTFKGYMRTDEWKSWTTVQNETVYSDLPVEHKLRRIILQAIPGLDGSNVDNTQMTNLMYDIELGLDTGQTRVWKGGIADLMRENYLDHGRPVVVGGFPYHLADKGIDISLGRVIAYAQGAGSQSGAVATTFPTFESARGGHVLKSESYSADNPSNLVVVGFAPFLTAQFRFDTEWDPATWLNPFDRKVVKLDIQTRDASSAASGRNAIVLDRLVEGG